MAKINKRTTARGQVEDHPDKTENYEGGVAFKMDSLSRLYTRVASCLVGEPKFYKEINDLGVVTADNQDKLLLQDIQEAAKIDPEFILQLAAYARNHLYLRTISTVLLVEASLIKECKPFVRKYTPAIIRRADELAEATAYLQRKIGNIGNKSKKGSMPSALKRGLADSFHNFNEYQFAKYNRKGFVKLKDVLKLVHPKPRNTEESELFKRIKDDSLKLPDTWEVVMSTKGSTKENWEAIAPKMPYMATLRNLRNFLNKGVDAAVMRSVVEKMADRNQVLAGKQFPFRYLSAYREIEGNPSTFTTKVLDALEGAMDVSVENLPSIKGTTFIVADNSGSMDTPISMRSSIKRSDIANTLMAVAHKMCEFPITGIFGETFAVKQFSQRNGVLSNVKSIRPGEVGHSTNAFLAVDYLIKNNLKVDRIIVFSDIQCYDSRAAEVGNYMSTRGYESLAEKVKIYKAKVNPNVFVYSIDLAGYGTMQIPNDEPRSCLMAGWTDKILTYIKLFEEDAKTAVDRIKEIKVNNYKSASSGESE